MRETLEETDLLVETTDIVGVYSRPQAAVVVVCWEARIVGGEPARRQKAWRSGLGMRAQSHGPASRFRRLHGRSTTGSDSDTHPWSTTRPPRGWPADSA